MRVKNKTVLVTGAGSGIGRQLVLELVRRGAKVIAVGRDPRKLEETVALAGVPLETHRCDLAHADQIRALAEAVGDIDGLINCAGIIQPFQSLIEIDDATIEHVMAVNFHGPLRMIRAFVPRMLSRPEAHVVNVSSMGGFFPFPLQSVYGASKAALKLMTEGLAGELDGTSVRVTIALPGATDTNIAVNSGVLMPAATEENRARISPADRSAREILDAMERNRTRVTVGKDATVLDWMYRLAPVKSAKLVAKEMKKFLTGGEAQNAPQEEG